MSGERATRVNGLTMPAQECPEGEHSFAAYHGYCLKCGVDGWTPARRREVLAAQAQVTH